MFKLLRKRRREKLMKTLLPPKWVDILERHVPCYRRLPQEARLRLQGIVRVLLDEKKIEGCGGMKLTDRIRLTITAYGALLLLGREGGFYPGLESILVYPDNFIPTRIEHIEDGLELVEEEPGEQEGESWAHGTVVLSWRVIQDDLRRFDGRNVIIHEMAHQLFDNAEPGWADPSTLRTWSRVLQENFERHRGRIEKGDLTFLDEYGAADIGEFFAVATEAFFESPRELRRRHPDLYEQLMIYYRQDPAAYFL